MDCEGDLAGFWEKRSPGSDGAFQAIEEFRIDSASGMLTICGRDEGFQSSFKAGEGQIEFGYRRRLRVLNAAGDGQFLSSLWQAEHEGVASEYRVRVTR